MRGCCRAILGTSICHQTPGHAGIDRPAAGHARIADLSHVLAVIFGIPLGVLSARWQGKPPDVAVRIFSIIGVSMPAFFLGLLLQILFFRNLDLLPLAGRVDSDLRFTNPIDR